MHQKLKKFQIKSDPSGTELPEIRGRIRFLPIATYSIALFAVLVSLSMLRVLDFYTLNGDLGINMQATWTNTHGYLLFESSDYKRFGAMSILEVNSHFLAMPFSYIYGLYPTPLTLFVVQDAAVSGSVIALFFLANRIIGDARYSFLLAVSYSSGAFLISATMYDFHWLSFLPLFTFLFFYLMLDRRIVLSILILILGSLTQQVFPFIASSVLLYLYAETRPRFTKNLKWLVDNNGIVYILLAILSVVMYSLLLYTQRILVPQYLGNQSAVSLIDQRLHAEWFPADFSPGRSLYSVGIWLSAYSLVLFIPVLEKRHLLLTFAWMYETILVYPSYGTFGNQYGFVTMSVLAPSVALGIRTMLRRGPEVSVKFLSLMSVLGFSGFAFLLGYGSIQVPRTALELTTGIVLSLVTAILVSFILVRYFRRSLDPKKVLSRSVSLMVISMIALNLVASPLNPANDSGNGFSGYKLSYGIPTQARYAGEIQGLIPGHNSTVIASDNLFTLVANDPFAYSFYDHPSTPGQPAFFPYNSTNPAKFVLVDSAQAQYIFSWVQALISNGTYGLELEILGNEYPGNISLYVLHYPSVPRVVNAD